MTMKKIEESVFADGQKGNEAKVSSMLLLEFGTTAQSVSTTLLRCFAARRWTWRSCSFYNGA